MAELLDVSEFFNNHSQRLSELVKNWKKEGSTVYDNERDTTKVSISPNRQ